MIYNTPAPTKKTKKKGREKQYLLICYHILTSTWTCSVDII
uniref:Uncharacterized protein n=1 Tax=Rhizophora mucronata TaxID=61149 RepID=A0A2P2PZV6_RHIMU